MVSGARAGWRGSREWLRARFPLVAELPGYNAGKFRMDFQAACTVALVSIPQAIGFALMAGLPVMMVLVSVVVGGLAAALFTSSHNLVFGPTNSVSILIASMIAAFAGYGLSGPDLAILMALLVGVIQIAAGLAQLGKLTQFISRSVIIGYSTAIGLLLVASQVGNLAGADVAGHAFFDRLWSFAGRIVTLDFNPYSLLLGVLTLVLFHFIGRISRRLPEELVGLVLLAVLARYTNVEALGVRLMRDEGDLVAALPSFIGLPLDMTHLSMVAPFLGAALAMAILGMLEAVSLGKTFAAKSGQRIDSNQEVISLGMGNVASSLFGAMPGSASFARTGTNVSAGACTQFSALMSSLVVLGSLFFITPVINYIPVPSLAAHLIRIGVRMVHRDPIRIAWKSTMSDRIAFAGTLLAAFFLRLDIAIYVGIGISLVLFLRKASAPSLVEYSFTDAGHLAQIDQPAQRRNPAISIVHVEGELFFGAADLFQDQVRQLAGEENIRVVILRMKNARHLDATSVMSLMQLHDYLRQNGRHLIVSGISPDVERVLRASGAHDKIGAENIFPAEVNLTMATKRALVRGSELLKQDGERRRADVRIFYNENRRESAANGNGGTAKPGGGAADYEI